ncbi:protein of unknown function [Candidatus Bipolaricaulis anaerobius]|uniref:Uncharacterized protein n=1 Tax=Candidatus Bipolaricaulis anaerobius TaxID=2026885 RepID=A0A2X3K7A7_9BACT|nr:protein of unknown function [Candidatus Bipolaricaulis anaerobius]
MKTVGIVEPVRASRPGPTCS